MKNNYATSEEIKFAESLFLPKGKTFEQDKIDIIQCNESKHIKACPGSGKTTTLLAKLAILSNRMPLENNQGICVLTHTNVAINEIKSKLGHKSDILFGYPNHFGTIQSFVDKYLAIPSYIERFGYKLKYIDDDASKSYINRKYFDLQTFEKTKWMFPQIKDRIPKNATHQVKNDAINKLKKELIEKIIVCFEQENFFFKTSYSASRILVKDSKSPTFQFLRDINYSCLQDGNLKFIDAYSFANYYLEKHPKLKLVFPFRFKYVFIDEMQDTDTYQLQIIEKIFAKENTIVQYFGDPHQSIFNKVKAEVVWNPDNPLLIKSSKRFGENIAKVLRSVCIEPNPDLKANAEINSLKPHLIIYNKSEAVLPKYCELVTTSEIELINGQKKTVLELAKEEKRPIKAVGWVGEPNKEDRGVDQLTIQSYVEHFRKNIKKKERVNYDSLKSFLKKQENASVKDYSDNIIKALVHILSMENIKLSNEAKKRNYTKTTLFSELKDTNPEMYSKMNKNLAVWSYKLNLSEGYDSEVTKTVKTFISDTFLTYFGISAPNKYTTEFLNNEPTSDISEKQLKKNNTYTWGDDKVQIGIGTIHSVKGETHIATLFLETCYEGKHDSEIIMDQLLGISYKTIPKDIYRKETLKMAYVAMSRPKYLLCMAIKKERIQSVLSDHDKNEKLRNLWVIVNV